MLIHMSDIKFFRRAMLFFDRDDFHTDYDTEHLIGLANTYFHEFITEIML